MGLNILEIPAEEDAIDISRVEDYLDGDPETVASFTDEDSLQVIANGASALEAFCSQIVNKGIDRKTAKAIYQQVDLINGNKGYGLESMGSYVLRGGNSAFTDWPSIDGLSVAVESIRETVMAAFKKIIERIKAAYTRFIEWIKSKFSKKTVDQIKQDLATKKSEMEQLVDLERFAKFLDGLGDDPARAATEFTRVVPGDKAEFESTTRQLFERMGEKLDAFFKRVEARPALVRILVGDISITELLKQEADEVINSTIKNGYEAAQAILMARNAAQLQTAVERGLEVLSAMDGSSEVPFSGAENFEGMDGGVSFGQIVSNLRASIDTINKTDFDSMSNELTIRVTEMMRNIEETSKQEIEELIAEDASEELRSKAVSTAVNIYAKLTSMSSTVARLWTLRVTALRGISSVATELSGFINELQSGIARSAQSLSDEQREALTKYLQSNRINFQI